MRRIVEIRDEEVGPVLWAALHVFGLLAANYLVRPVRDEMGVAGGSGRLPLLFAGTFAAMLAIGTWLPGWAGRRAGGPDLSRLYRLTQLGLLGFLAAFCLLPVSASAHAARAFFVAASVGNLLVVSVAWASIADGFSFDQARRLFGLIAAGGTLGAITGSALAGALAGAAGPAGLLVPAIMALELARLGARRLRGPRVGAGAAGARASAESGQGLESLRSPYLVGMGLYYYSAGSLALLFTPRSRRAASRRFLWAAAARRFRS